MWGSSRRRRSTGIRSRIDVEVREEIRFYLEMRAAELEKEGLPPAEAWRRAVEAFGDPEAMAAEAVRESGEEARGGIMGTVDGIRQDFAHALRNLRKARGFTTVAVLTLALGMGATTAVYSVVRGVLLRPLPYDEPGNLVAIWSRWVPESGYDWPKYPVGSPEYFDYLKENHTMESVAAVSTERLTFTAGIGDPEMVTAGAVTPSMFTTLRVPPYLGRTLVEEDGGPDPAPVVVLGYDFWQRRFGGDSTIVGRTLHLGWENQANKVRSTVVGVMPPGFAFPDPDVDLWAPLLLDPARTWRGGHWFGMIGRLARGETLRGAQAEMANIMARWREVYPDHHRGHFLYMTSLLDDAVAGVRPALLLLLGAVALVLLVACANVASLVLARGYDRSREMAVRTALGASRGRLARHLLVEALVLACVGGVLGLLVAHFGVDGLLALEGGTLPRLDQVRVDGGVLAFSGVLVVSATLIFGLVPAGTLARTRLTRAFSEGGSHAGTGSDRLRLRRVLVVSEITLACVLVIGAGLMAKSLWRILEQDPGFEVEHVLVTRFTFPESRYSGADKLTFVDALLERVKAHPGMVAAAVADRPPILFDQSWSRFSIPDRPAPESEEEAPTASLVTTDENVFRTLGISLVRGRLFDATDEATGPRVAIIDETMAARYWPGEDPVGRRISLGSPEGERIVGVVTNARWDGLMNAPPTFYILDRQIAQEAPFHLGTPTLLTRTRGDPMAVSGVVRDAIHELDAEIPVFMMRPMADVVASSLAGQRFVLTLMVVFAGLALLLGVVGVYGVISQAVSQRTREIGIRRALGAHSGDVVGMVLRQGMTVAAVGVVLGLGAAASLGGFLEAFLYEVRSTDVWTYGLVALAVGAVAAVAILVPARRASRVDPMEALRME
ncbi:MAG: ABC transporter permease [Gemmatimonadetes bacterium]|nr:ABC transporter permease [Gemmatimonadota bacterium]